MLIEPSTKVLDSSTQETFTPNMFLQTFVSDEQSSVSTIASETRISFWMDYISSSGDTFYDLISSSSTKQTSGSFTSSHSSFINNGENKLLFFFHLHQLLQNRILIHHCLNEILFQSIVFVTLSVLLPSLSLYSSLLLYICGYSESLFCSSLIKPSVELTLSKDHLLIYL